MAEFVSDITAEIRNTIHKAVDAILDSTEDSLKYVALARAGDVSALDGLEQRLCSILEACAFQDLSGQRLTKIDDSVGAHRLAAPRDILLSGPAAAGEGLDQGAVDALIATRAIGT